jgi:hypothetical protein
VLVANTMCCGLLRRLEPGDRPNLMALPGHKPRMTVLGFLLRKGPEASSKSSAHLIGYSNVLLIFTENSHIIHVSYKGLLMLPTKRPRSRGLQPNQKGLNIDPEKHRGCGVPLAN